MFNCIFQFFIFFLPWKIRRFFLEKFFGFDINPTARIGFSLVSSRVVRLDEFARIGHFNVIKGLDSLTMNRRASIGRGNWISGFPTGAGRHFSHVPDRSPSLYMGNDSAITHRHIIDCTSKVSIGNFSTLAGYATQILTHGIDIYNGRQDTSAVEIGDYCFIGTRCIFVHGSYLASFSVLGAGSTVTKRLVVSHRLYGGIPAREIKLLETDSKYFIRNTGFVD